MPTFQSDAWFPFDAFCYYSDDDGKTWQVSKTKMQLPGHGAQEPSLVRLKSGKLLAVLRTSLGSVYKSYSVDEGETWQNIKTIEDRNPGASSTPAITFVGDEALLTFNTQPYALSKRELYSIRLKTIPIDWFRSE